MFGVREETIQRAPIVEFKYAQGAKPGLGGHLLGDKATSAVAKMRESVPWVSLFSPFPFHSVYSVEDHKKHIDWIKTVNPGALVSVKVSTPTDVDMVAVGSYYAGAHIIHLDGAYGGTGAAPEIAKKNIAMPIELAIPKVHRFLLAEGIRDEVVLIASGGVRTAHDIAKAIALGADGCVLGTAELIALGCTRCSNCERGRGCPYGLTTTDPELQQLVDPAWGAERIANMYAAYQRQLVDILRRLALPTISGPAGPDRPPSLPREGDAMTRADMTRVDLVKARAASRRRLSAGLPPATAKVDAEGGCGVIGMAASVPVAGRHLLRSLAQMRNRGNGKGGGIAAAGLSPDALGVSREVLSDDYLLAVAYLDPAARAAVEAGHITPTFTVDHVHRFAGLADWREIGGLELAPPEVVAYFVRVRPAARERFRQDNPTPAGGVDAVDDEIVYQNSYALNRAFYASTGDKRAFVLSHGKDLLVLKMVGYGEDVVRYYRLEDFPAHVWIGHHRYPTKGRVWHPGGAHPFIGHARGAGPQRRLRQLRLDQRLPGPARHHPAVPHRHRGRACWCSTCSTAATATRSSW